jgi:inner membrane protein involved in colicin E2 resistance
LFWHRTFNVDFQGSYTIDNPTPIAQTIYVRFQFPAADASYNDFSFVLNGVPSTENRQTSEGITEAVTLEPGAKATLEVAYKTRGTDRWGYSFGDTTRVRNFDLTMKTDFDEINFPNGTGSATERKRASRGWTLRWAYPDVIGAQAIAMDMPNVLNPGPVASRITFFAPVSLLFFFAVLLLMTTVRRVNLHPMNYFFLAAGFFAFQLLFAYLVDLIPLLAAFVAASAVSLVLVSGYLFLAAGKTVARIAATAQFAYMVLFSYSFFFDGLTGITITIGSIVTLALLMVTTAKVDWSEKFASPRKMPPPIPA